MANHYLQEKMTPYDWGAVLFAFAGILIIQNPFDSKDQSHVDFLDDLIGTTLALSGALLASIATLCQRQMNHYAKLHYIIAPIGFALGNVILCPLALGIKILFFDKPSEGSDVRGSLH